MLKAKDGRGAGILEQSECLTAVRKAATFLEEEESSGMEGGKEEPGGSWNGEEETIGNREGIRDKDCLASMLSG